jgi:hypothetical protein
MRNIYSEKKKVAVKSTVKRMTSIPTVHLIHYSLKPAKSSLMSTNAGSIAEMTQPRTTSRIMDKTQNIAMHTV